MRSLQTLLKFAGFALAVCLAAMPSLKAQVVTSGLTGLVRDTAGAAVAGAQVVAVHEPTGATFRATTAGDGRYNFRGLPVGGPYTLTVTAAGFPDAKRTDVETALGTEIDISFSLDAGASDVIELSELEIQAEANSLDPSAIGAGSVLSATQIQLKPTSERSFADMISATPLVTLRATFGDREESQITAVGQNNRYNSIMIDGARINDQFGLNGTGMASFFNPLSLDTLEQLSVQITPYDVRMAGATGAYINAVTKSGTNHFKGTAYYLFQGDSWGGVQLRGYNAREEKLTGAKVLPLLERETLGFTFGGPIIKNKLFFFTSYEKFESLSAGRDPRFSTPNEQTILDRLDQITTAAGDDIDWGNPVTDATTNLMEDEKVIAKIDWNIVEGHRLSVRYSKTEGEVPQFGNFASSSTSLTGISGSGGITTTPDGHFYSQQRAEESYAVQLFSQWSPDFKTELRYSETTQDQLTPLNTVAPMIMIQNVSGTDLLNNTSVTNGAYVVGTEQFRHGNEIKVDGKQFTLTGDYFLGGIALTGGVEREQSDFYNLFRQQSYGVIAFRTYADFLADTNAVIYRNYYDPALRDPADISDFAMNSVYLQAKWDPMPRLTVTAGLRYDVAQMDSVPAFNQALYNASGFRNDGTLDGSSSVSPRVGLNYAFDDERVMQVRGGIGHFSGRAPWVFFSNSFNALGVGDFSRSSSDATNPLPTSLTAYLRDHFDPANPIGTGTDNPALRRAVNWMDDGLSLPSVWRGNLAVDRKLGFLNSTFTAEIVRTKIDEALFITNENLRRSSALSADGRWRFAGNPTTQANAKYSGFTDLYRISNVSVGQSTYWTLSWNRPITDRWGFDVAYSHGNATEAQAIGQTTASGQWQRNVVFNQGEATEGTSDFEIRERLQASISRQFEFRDGWRTTASLYFETRTGNPYSWVYGSDLNGDGRNDNDIFAVPVSTSDPRFDFSAMAADQVQMYFQYLNEKGLMKYAGGIAPRNAFVEPWVNRLDLRLEQVIPIYNPVRLKLFLDFVNFGAFISRDFFGYTEIAPQLSNDVFRRRTFGTAAYAADGRIRPNPLSGNITGFNIDNGMSRWRIQLGAKIEF
jgi:hypothetical protein